MEVGDPLANMQPTTYSFNFRHDQKYSNIGTEELGCLTSIRIVIVFRWSINIFRRCDNFFIENVQILRRSELLLKECFLMFKINMSCASNVIIRGQ